MSSRVALFRPLLLLPAALVACSTPPSAPHAILDERSGVTINAVSTPLLFFRIHGNGQYGARDYVTLVALEKDNAGKYTQLLLMYRWSLAVNGSYVQQPKPNTGRLVIVADSREFVLEPLDHIPVELTASKDLFVPMDESTKYAYLTDFQTMRAIAASHQLVVKLPQEEEAPDTLFSLFRDGRPALAELVNQLNGP
jgi:hypothetical protein